MVIRPKQRTPEQEAAFEAGFIEWQKEQSKPIIPHKHLVKGEIKPKYIPSRSDFDKEPSKDLAIREVYDKKISNIARLIEKETNVSAGKLLDALRGFVQSSMNGYYSDAGQGVMAKHANMSRPWLNVCIGLWRKYGVLFLTHRSRMNSKNQYRQTTNETRFIGLSQALKIGAQIACDMAGESLRKAVSKAESQCQLSLQQMTVSLESGENIDKSTGEILHPHPSRNLPPDIQEAFKDFIGVPA